MVTMSGWAPNPAAPAVEISAPNMSEARSVLIESFRSAKAIRARMLAYEKVARDDVERAFAAFADIGVWNRSHVDAAIVDGDLIGA